MSKSMERAVGTVFNGDAFYLTVAWLLAWPVLLPVWLAQRGRTPRARRPLTPIERTCPECYAPAHHRCITWDGWAWQPMPRPHPVRAL